MGDDDWVRIKVGNQGQTKSGLGVEMAMSGSNGLAWSLGQQHHQVESASCTDDQSYGHHTWLQHS